MHMYVFLMYFDAFFWTLGWGDPEGNLVFSQVRCLSLFSSLLELAAGAAEVVSRTVARTPPPTHAGGQDDGSYTNALKLIKKIKDIFRTIQETNKDI